MKRAAGLIFIILIFALGYFSLWGNLPFAPVLDSSMEPALKSGSLVFTKPVRESSIKIDDIVIYNVPHLTRETTNYPPLIARRVIEITKNQSVTWLSLGGDNTGEGPFQVRISDIRGTLRRQIPYLGFPFFIFQSWPGTMFIALVIVLFALYLYSGNIGIFLSRRLRTFISPIIEENHRVNLVLSNRFEATEKALEGFSAAMQEYARNLASHTRAIQGLSEASQSLKWSAAEQNRVLSQITEAFTQQRSNEEVLKMRQVVNDFERRTQEALFIKDILEKGIPVSKPVARVEPLLMTKIQSPLGCAVKPKALQVKPHYYS